MSMYATQACLVLLSNRQSLCVSFSKALMAVLLLSSCSESSQDPFYI